MPGVLASHVIEGVAVIPDKEQLKALNSIADNHFHLSELVKQFRRGTGVVPFVGAGFSMPYGYPSWKDYLVTLAADWGLLEVIRDRIDEGMFEEAAQALLDAMNHRAFHDAITASFSEDHIQEPILKGAVSLIPRIATGPVITTNFDRVLEKVFEAAGCPFDDRVLGAQADAFVDAFRSDLRLLLKIHGDYQFSDNRILTVADYDEYYGTMDGGGVFLDKPLPRLLGKLMENRFLLFLGCSLGPDRTVAVLKRVIGDHPSVYHYAIVSQPEDPKEFQNRRIFMSAHGIRPIWYPHGRHDLVGPILAHLLRNNCALPPPSKPHLDRSPLLMPVHDDPDETGTDCKGEAEGGLRIEIDPGSEVQPLKHSYRERKKDEIRRHMLLVGQKILNRDQEYMRITKGTVLMTVTPERDFAGEIDWKEFASKHGSNLWSVGTNMSDGNDHDTERFRFFCGEKQDPTAEVSFLKSGAIESWNRVLISNSLESRRFLHNETVTCVPSSAIERKPLLAYHNYFKFMKESGIPAPWYAALSILHLPECELGPPRKFKRARGLPCNTQLIEPPIILVDASVDVSSFESVAERLKPMFDHVWMAFGFPASLSYDRSWKWMGD